MSASTYINLAIDAFRRHNPILEAIDSIQQVLNTVLNYKSNAKLNQYRKSLYMQQLTRMESFIAQGSPYQYRGDKIDRRF